MSEESPQIDPHAHIKRMMKTLAEAGLEWEPLSYRFVSPTGRSTTEEELKLKRIVNVRIPELEVENKEE